MARKIFWHEICYRKIPKNFFRIRLTGADDKGIIGASREKERKGKENDDQELCCSYL